MEQEVYIDLYFLVNFSMDLLCLMMVARLMHVPIRKWRTVGAAALGGIWASVSLLVGSGSIVGILADAGVACLMCALCFTARGEHIGRLLRATATQVLCSVLLGGVMTVLFSLLNRLQLPWDRPEGDGISVWSFALLTAVAGLATFQGGRVLGASHRTESAVLEAELFGQSVRLRGRVDSGNLLRDPISGKSVVIADARSLLPILPPALRQAAQTSDALLWLQAELYAGQIRLIPTQTATGSSLLPALTPSRLTAVWEDGTKSTKDYLIAVSHLGRAAEGFDALLPAD